MQTAREMAVEAIHCRESGDHHGYGQYLLEMEAMGLSPGKIRSLVGTAGSPPNGSSNGSQPRDPRLPIPESEWERPRLGFVR